MTGVPAPSRQAPAPRARREGLRNLVVLGFVAFILFSGLREALQGGGVESLLGMAIPLFVVAILFLARRHKAQRSGSAGSSQDAGSGAKKTG